MQKRNYQRELDSVIEKQQAAGKVPTLLLHSCCAPCSSYCMEYLSQYFRITVFYYNPNITEKAEYCRRVEEQKRLIGALPVRYPIQFMEGTYEPEKFFTAAKGLEEIPEGGERCRNCFLLRLAETGRVANEYRFSYFTTTLSISPLKNAVVLNEIGEAVAAQCGVAYLCSDFKKKNGYKRSVELSAEYDLYRQDYCGCIFSRKEAEHRRKNGVYAREEG